MSVKKNLIKNGISSILLKSINSLEQILLVPFFISAWGTAYYGEWLTLTIIPSVIGLSNFGFGTAVANTFVLKYAAGDKQGAANIYKSGILTLSFIILMSVIISFLVIAGCNYFQVFNNLLINKNDAIITVSILMTSKIITFYKQLYDAFYRASRRFNISINLQSVYSLLILISSIIILSLKGSILLFAISNLIFTIFYVTIHSIVAKKILSLKSHQGTIIKSEILNLLKIGFGYLLAPLWQAIFFQGTTFVVRVVLGPISVTIFNTVRALTRTIYQGNALILSSLTPELQYSIGQENYNLARKLFRFCILMGGTISFLGIVSLLTIGPWFYKLWTGNSVFLPDTMWYIFIAGISFNTLWTISSEIILSANKPYKFTIAASALSLISVIISYILSIHFGLSGAAIGSLMMDVFMFSYLFPISCELLNQPLNLIINNIIFDLKDLKTLMKTKFQNI